MRLRTRTLSTQILGGQVIVLIVAGAIGFAFSERAVRHLVDHQYEQRALAIAETTATMPTIRAAMANQTLASILGSEEGPLAVDGSGGGEAPKPCSGWVSVSR